MDLVGLSEVAEIAGVSRQAVVNWRARFPDFPAPAAELASGPVWTRDEIEKWLKQREKNVMESTIVKETNKSKTGVHSVSVSNFDRVDIGSAIKAEIIQNEGYSVEVISDSSMFDHVDISKSGTTLRVRLKPMILFWHSNVRMTIKMPVIRSLKASGAVAVSAAGFKSSEPLDINASGASSIRLKEMQTGNSEMQASGASNIFGELEMSDGEIKVSGASSVELKGKAGDLHIDASGASSVFLGETVAHNADVKLTGASKVALNLNGKMDANLSGASRLSYSGEFKMEKIQVSGASTLIQK